MKSSLLIIVLVALVSYEGNCQLFGTTPGDLVGGLELPIITDIFTILINGTVHVTGDCETAYDVSKVQYWLYTRQQPNEPVIVTSPDQIDGTKSSVVLIHGWGGNADIDYIHVIKNAYLQEYDWNVISVDYSVYAASNYQSGYCHVPAVGEHVAKFLCSLPYDVKDIHVVGHSMGGQVAGFAGKATQEQCGKIGRITALDPAGPLYQVIDPAQRLDKIDAVLVDVVHTNQAQYGYTGNCGSVDFYPNCGYFQPKCLSDVLKNSLNLDNLLDLSFDKLLTLPLSLVSCNHQRSCFLFAESIISNNFRASPCNSLCGVLPACGPKLFSTTTTPMGESCRSQPSEKTYVLYTTGEPPYVKNSQD